MHNSTTEELEKLIEQAKAGDSQAFGRLYEEFYTPVFRYLYSRTSGHKAESEDLTQIVFIRLWEHLDTFTWSGSTPLAYCFRIARNLLIDRSRKKTALPLDETIDIPDGNAKHPGEHMDIIQEENEIKALVKKLSDEEQELLHLRFGQELRHQEIADLLGKSPEAVRQTQRRIIQKLRTLLSNNL